MGSASTSRLVCRTPVGYSPVSRTQCTVSPVAVVVLLIRSTMTWWVIRGRPQDPGDLGGGAQRVLLLQCHRQLQHLGRGPRADPGRGRHQRLEPAGAPVADPAADRLLRDPDLLPGRAVMLTAGQLADQRAALAGRQARAGHVLDQLVAEQPRLPGPLGPAAGLLNCLSHLVPPFDAVLDSPAPKGGRPARRLTRGSWC